MVSNTIVGYMVKFGVENHLHIRDSLMGKTLHGLAPDGLDIGLSRCSLLK